MQLNYQYHLPTCIHFEPGAANALGDHAAAVGKRPFVVAGMRSARALGLIDRVVAAFPDAVLFEGVDENPTDTVCDEGAALCREAGCDSVIALGGGSPIDAAKAIAGLALHDGPCAGFFGRDTFPNGALPLLAVPTTAGAGSEVTPYAVLVHAAADQKATIGSACLFPRVAVLDPDLTLALPRTITINTGLDALAQAMEGIVSVKANPVAEIMAFEAIRIIHRWLPVAADEPDDRTARANMLHAAMLAGCVIAQTGTTLVHGMGYYFTLASGVAHGMANALLLTPLFQHNATVVPGKVARIAEALGHPCDARPESAGRAVAAGVHALLHRMRVSPAAGDAGVHADQLAEFAEQLAGEPYRFRNQLGTLDEADCLRLFKQAYHGSIV